MARRRGLFERPEYNYYEVGGIGEMRTRVTELRSLAQYYKDRLLPTLRTTIDDFRKRRALSSADYFTEIYNAIKMRVLEMENLVIPHYIEDIKEAEMEEQMEKTTYASPIYSTSYMKARKISNSLVVVPKMPRIKIRSLKKR